MRPTRQDVPGKEDRFLDRVRLARILEPSAGHDCVTSKNAREGISKPPTQASYGLVAPRRPRRPRTALAEPVGHPKLQRRAAALGGGRRPPAHAVPTRPRPHPARVVISPHAAQDPGHGGVRGRPLPQPHDPLARGRPDGPRRRARAALQRRPRRSHRPGA